VLAMMEAAMDHDGFSFIRSLSECVNFTKARSTPRTRAKGGMFMEVPKNHDTADRSNAYRLAGADFPVISASFTTQQAHQNAKEATSTRPRWTKSKA